MLSHAMEEELDLVNLHGSVVMLVELRPWGGGHQKQSRLPPQARYPSLVQQGSLCALTNATEQYSSNHEVTLLCSPEPISIRKYEPWFILQWLLHCNASNLLVNEFSEAARVTLMQACSAFQVARSWQRLLSMDSLDTIDEQCNSEVSSEPHGSVLTCNHENFLINMWERQLSTFFLNYHVQLKITLDADIGLTPSAYTQFVILFIADVVSNGTGANQRPPWPPLDCHTIEDAGGWICSFAVVGNILLLDLNLAMLVLSLYRVVAQQFLFQYCNAALESLQSYKNFQSTNAWSHQCECSGIASHLNSWPSIIPESTRQIKLGTKVEEGGVYPRGEAKTYVQLILFKLKLLRRPYSELSVEICLHDLQLSGSGTEAGLHSFCESTNRPLMQDSRIPHDNEKM
jgi:hypothetical protein